MSKRVCGNCELKNLCVDYGPRNVKEKLEEDAAVLRELTATATSEYQNVLGRLAQTLQELKKVDAQCGRDYSIQMELRQEAVA